MDVKKMSARWDKMRTSCGMAFVDALSPILSAALVMLVFILLLDGVDALIV